MIHAGLYYPAGSLKAQLCIEGASRLYSFCASHAVPADRCGKLVVATSPEEIAELDVPLIDVEDEEEPEPEVVEKRKPAKRERKPKPAAKKPVKKAEKAKPEPGGIGFSFRPKSE